MCTVCWQRLNGLCPMLGPLLLPMYVHTMQGKNKKSLALSALHSLPESHCLAICSAVWICCKIKALTVANKIFVFAVPRHIHFGFGLMVRYMHLLATNSLFTCVVCGCTRAHSLFFVGSCSVSIHSLCLLSSSIYVHKQFGLLVLFVLFIFQFDSEDI